MFVGAFHCKMDDKRRIPLPPKFIKEVGGEAFINESPDGCLLLFPVDSWQEVKRVFRNLPHPSQKAKIKKVAYSWEISIPPDLRDYAGLSKDVVIVGFIDYIEIWSEKKWVEVTEKEARFMTLGIF